MVRVVPPWRNIPPSPTEVQSTHDRPIRQGEVAGRPKQELWALGRKTVEPVLPPIGGAAGAASPVRERGQEQIGPDALPRGAPGGAVCSAMENRVREREGQVT